MEALILAGASAWWLGLCASLNPCPLATNLAAVSYVGRHLRSPLRVALAALFYCAGQGMACLAVVFAVWAGLLSSRRVSNFLQEHANQFLGPLLILAGMFLLGWIRFRLPGARLSERMRGCVEGAGVWGALLLGILLALSFCPVSAAFFFGGLLPLAIKARSVIIVPAAYAAGFSLPVLLFAALIAIGTGALPKALRGATQVERWARGITGTVFLAIGVHYSLKYIFGWLPVWDPWVQSVAVWLDSSFRPVRLWIRGVGGRG